MWSISRITHIARSLRSRAPVARIPRD
jgi:hypothetical protein